MSRFMKARVAAVASCGALCWEGAEEMPLSTAISSSLRVN